MIGSLEVEGKHSFVDPEDEEADKEDYIHNGRNDRAAVLNVYHFLWPKFRVFPVDRLVYRHLPRRLILIFYVHKRR